MVNGAFNLTGEYKFDRVRCNFLRDALFSQPVCPIVVFPYSWLSEVQASGQFPVVRFAIS